MKRYMNFERKAIQFSQSENSLWVPVYTRPLHEFRLYEYFEERRIPVYLPVVSDFKIHNVWKNQKPHSYKRAVLRPMLRSYVFAQMTEEQKRGAWRSNSINNIWDVPKELQPSFIEELRGLRMLENLAQSAKLEFRKEIQVHDRFIIESPREYEGTYGYLVEKRKRFLWVVRIEFLNWSVVAEIDPSCYKMKKVE